MLFGPAPGEAQTRRRWGLRYATVACVLALIFVARRPDAVTNPQFWEEDGFVFFYQNLMLGFWGALRSGCSAHWRAPFAAIAASSGSPRVSSSPSARSS